MSLKQQKAVLLSTLFINGGHRIQQEAETDLLSLNDTEAVITVDGYLIFIPRHLIAIVPPDSPRDHKHKKKIK